MRGEGVSATLPGQKKTRTGVGRAVGVQPGVAAFPGALARGTVGWLEERRKAGCCGNPVPCMQRMQDAPSNPSNTN